MSTRQYVGARYVPKFSDPIAWDKQRAYEALEIVTYLGTSYTSKKPVPVGTEIDNEEYWVVTGNYNAQVEQYRQDVEKVKTEIAKTNTNLVNISKNIALNALPIRDFVNYYGANHTSDMTELLQTALNECSLNGIILFVPKGDYTIKSSITLPDGAKLIGAGMFDTRFICESDFLIGNTSSFECENYFLYGFSANGLKDNGQCGIKLWGVSGNIEYVCMNSFALGFYFTKPDTTYQTKVNQKEGHYVNNCTAMYCDYGFKSLMYDCVYNNIVCSRCIRGWVGGANALINNIHIWGFSVGGISISSGQVNNIEIEGCTVTHPEYCIYLDGGNIEINNLYFWNCRTTNYWWVLDNNCNVVMKNVIVGQAGTLTTANEKELHGFTGNANSVIFEGVLDDSYDDGRLYAPNATITRSIMTMISKNAIQGCSNFDGQKKISLID